MRCLLFLVTNGSLTLVFHVGENHSHKMFAIFSYKWQLDTFVFDMGINSIGAYKLSGIVSRILSKKKLSFLNCFYVSAVAVYSFI